MTHHASYVNNVRCLWRMELKLHTSGVGRCKIFGWPGQESKCAPSFFSLQIANCGQKVDNLAAKSFKGKKGIYNNSKFKSNAVQQTWLSYLSRSFFFFSNYWGGHATPILYTHALQIIGRPCLPASLCREQFRTKIGV